jgi:hypothetical protein
LGKVLSERTTAMAHCRKEERRPLFSHSTPFFNSNAWKSTVSSAKGGTSPVGAKSLFPETWGRDEIAAAIVAVLEHPEPVVLRRRAKNSIPHFYLRSKINDVDVEVGLNGNRVGTAFPSWRQYHPATIGQANEQ